MKVHMFPCTPIGYAYEHWYVVNSDNTHSTVRVTLAANKKTHTNYILILRDSDVAANFKRLPANRAASQDMLLHQLLEMLSTPHVRIDSQKRDSCRFQRGNAKN